MIKRKSTSANSDDVSLAAVAPRRKWWRRLKITLLVLVCLAVVLRLAIFLALPVVLRKTASHYGMECTYERSELTLLGGDFGLWHVDVRPINGTEPLIKAGYVRGNLSALALLTGKLYIWRAEVDGVDLAVHRTAEGRIPVLEEFLAGLPDSPSAQETSPAPQTEKKWSLASPLKVDAIRISRIRVHLKDDATQPPLDTMVQLDLRVSDLGSRIRPASFDVDLMAEGILSALRLSGERRGDASSADANVRLTISGLDLRPLEGYLRPLGIKPIANNLTLRMRAETELSLTPESALAGQVKLTDVAVVADGKEAASLGAVVLDIDSLDERAAKLSKLSIEAGRLGAMRTAEGVLRVAGIDLLPVAPSVAASATMPAAPQGASANPDAAAGFASTLAELSIQDVRVTFLDAAVTPQANLAITLNSLSSRDLILDPKQPDAVVAFIAAMQVPGAMHSLQIDGEVRPFAVRKTAELGITAAGIRPDALKPYLAKAGLESLYKDGSLRLKVSGAVEVEASGRILADAKIADFDLRDGGSLLGMEMVSIRGATIDAAANSFRVESVEVAGPATTIRKEAGGTLAVAGMRLGGAKTSSSAGSEVKAKASGASVTAESQGKQRPMRLDVGHFAWRSPNVRFEDEQIQPVAVLSVTDAGVELRDLSLNLDPAAAVPSKPGQIKAWLAAPGVAKKIEVEGTFLPQVGAISAEAVVRGEGITGSGLKSYLQAAGVEPVLTDGSLELQMKVNVVQREEQMTSSLQIQDLRYVDGEAELIGLDLLRVADVVWGGDFTVGSVEINRARFAATRTADDEMVLAGMRLLPKAPAPTAASPIAPSAATAQPSSAPPTAFVLRSVRLRDASVDWADQAVSPAVLVRVGTDVEVDSLVLGRAAPDAKVRVRARVAGAVDQLVLAGTVNASPEAQAARIEIAGEGLRAGPLASYLPPGMRVTLADGRLKTAIEASTARNKEGGASARFLIDGFDYRDGPEGDSLLRFDYVRLTASRLDMAGGVLALDEISLAGLESALTLEPLDRTRLLGLLLTPVPAAVNYDAAAAPAVASLPAPAAMTPPAVRKMLPLVTLKNLDLNIRRFTVHDQSRSDLAPLVLSDMRLHNIEDIALGGNDPAAQPPLQLQLTARLEPGVGKIDVSLVSAPFAAEPNAQIDLAIHGIDGSGLLSLAPDLGGRIDSQMKEGSFKAHLEGQIKFQRRYPEEFDLSRGFDLAMLLKGVEFRAEPDGEVLAGLESLHVDGASIWPATGAATIKSVELSKPIGRMYRDKDGVHAMGFLMLAEAPVAATSQAAAEGAEAAATAPVAAAESAPMAESVSASPAVRPAAEIRLDRLLVSGLDVVVEDRSVTPPVLIPLTGLDVEVRDLSNWALYEDRPFRFNILVNSGKVELAKRMRGGGIAGAVGDMAGLLAGKGETSAIEYERRELLSQIAVSGKVSLYPKLRGWVKSSVNGLEVAGFKGLVAQSGVLIGSGVLDTSVDLRMPGDGSIEAHSRVVMTDLTMSEPKNGPIVRHLHMAMPLDALIGLLEGADGSIKIPLRVSITNGQVRGMAEAAMAALTSVIATSVASAPVKMVGGVADVVGFGIARPKNLIQPVVVTFLPGAVRLEPGQQAEIASLIEQLRYDATLQISVRHELGSGDVEVMEVRANPDAAQAALLAYQLRARKMDLAAQRSGLAGQARALLASGSSISASLALQRLRSTAREQAQIEDALDNVYDLMRPGAQRQGPRRTRQACLNLASDRLHAVRSALLASDIPGLAQRIRLTNPQVRVTEGQLSGQVTITMVATK